MTKRKLRNATCSLIDLVDQGVVDARTVMDACLAYMSEWEVRDMSIDNGFLEADDDE